MKSYWAKLSHYVLESIDLRKSKPVRAAATEGVVAAANVVIVIVVSVVVVVLTAADKLVRASRIQFVTILGSIVYSKSSFVAAASL